MPTPPPPPITLLLLLILHLSLLHAAAPPPFPHPDLAPLLSFKSSSDISDHLSSWTTTNSSNPCHPSPAFHGVSCLHNRVTGLVLHHLNLHGRFDSLTSLVKLRLLSLSHNNLSGPIPNLSNLKSLKLLYLSHNQISGDFPPELPSLFRLDLSYNTISGRIPITINRLTRLLTLRLESNRISGSVNFLNLPNLQDFNISMNKISGEIPVGLSQFPKSVFLNNSGLCGLPVVECRRPEVQIPSSPVVASSPTSKPSTAALPEKKVKPSGGRKIGTLAVAGIVIGDVLVLSIVSLLLYCYFSGGSTDRNVVKGAKTVYPSSTTSSKASSLEGRMVFYGGTRRFELEDLLKASAEMLGRGGLGTVYKAVLDGGDVVAVKRLKEVAVSGRREFEERMEVIGRLRHPNVVSLKAYYFAKDEKLLVHEYMSNGNLFWLLHGNRGPGRTPLDWPTRLKIAAGAARGLSFIHTTHKLTHGNIKSTNILLDKSHSPSISDLGHSAITPPTTASRSTGYRAPELSPPPNHRKPTQKSDVYSFGVLLMELLTGKCPSMADNSGVLDLPRWVRSVVREEWTAEVFDLELMSYKDIEEEMIGLLNIGLSCTSVVPDQRPTMEYVAKKIHEIEGVQRSPSREVVDSVSDSPSVVRV